MMQLTRPIRFIERVVVTDEEAEALGVASLRFGSGGIAQGFEGVALLRFGSGDGFSGIAQGFEGRNALAVE